MSATSSPPHNADTILQGDLLATDVSGEPLAGDRVSVPLSYEALRAIRVLNRTEGISHLKRIRDAKGRSSMASRLSYLLQLGANAVLKADASGSFNPPTDGNPLSYS